MSECCVCKSKSIEKLLDTGQQPISNRFISNLDENEYTHRMVQGQCNSCGLVQLVDMAPASELLSRYEWIAYNEPEGHLDDLTDIITRLPDINKDSTFLGVSFKEDSTLVRLNNLGFRNTRRIDPNIDLGITEKGAAIETIQDRLKTNTLDRVIQKYGQSDVVIARHILEHAFEPKQFMKSMYSLVKNSGYVVFEVPDCTKMLDTLDYTMLWEEHILYLTPATFKGCLGFGPFSIYLFKSFPYPVENAMVGIVKPQVENIQVFPLENTINREKRLAKVYLQGFEQQKKNINICLSDYRRNHGEIAVFGAGHLSSVYINLMNIKDHIEFVVDDNPNKKGLFMPGSRLPIYGSDFLVKENIKLCLLSLSPESEAKVIDRNHAFLDQGGRFASIFPASKKALVV